VLFRSPRYKITHLMGKVEDKSSDLEQLTAYDSITMQSSLRKRDIRLLPLLITANFLSILCRSNIAYTRISNAPEGTLDVVLGLTDFQAMSSISIFFVAFIVFQVPSNMMVKVWSPSRWLAFISFSWGIVTLSLGFVKNFYALFALRLVLGIFQAGFFPGVIYYLTFWYPQHALTLRIGVVFCASMLSGVFGGVISWGVTESLHLIGDLEGWRWLFICEGIPTMLVGSLLFFLLPDYPETCSFLTDNEVKAVQASLGSSRQLQETLISRAAVCKIMARPSTYLYCITLFLLLTSMYSFSFAFPSILLQMGHTPRTAQLLSSPPYIFALASILLNGRLVDKYNVRFPVLLSALVLQISGFGGMILFSDNINLKYASSFLACIGSNTLISPFLSWVTQTAGSEEKGSSTEAGFMTGLVLSIGNLGGFLNAYLYPRAVGGQAASHDFGNLVNVIFGVFAICGCIGIRMLVSRSM